MKRNHPPGARMTLCGTSPRAYAELVEGTVIKFFYPCGNVETRDMGKGPVSKRLSVWASARMASWWSKEKGGVIAECPKCRRRALKEVREERGCRR